MAPVMTDAAQLKLFNSLTRQLEVFRPIHEGEARVYSCGPTVYNYPHIGNMRAYVFADVLGRTLSFKGYKLTHVINITDVGHLTDDADTGEDKLEKAAAANAQSIWDIAKHYTEAFWADVKALNIRQPSQWTIATDYVPAMIEFAKSIAEKHCYEIEGGLYFDVTSVAGYGRLARTSKEAFVAAAEVLFNEGRFEDAEIAARKAIGNPSQARSRVGAVDGKRNAADFAIWRKTPPGETRQMEWDSPWGRGAPGWHLECSVMSGEVLGFPFDIHTGGIDHREIHHPCEIAQNQAFCHSDASGANIWMHNNFLVERSGKMSKSSGEFLRLQLLEDRGYHPLAYRLMCLQAHYRSELEFSWEVLEAALVRLKRILGGMNSIKVKLPRFFTAAMINPRDAFADVPLEFSDERMGSMLLGYLKRFDDAISDDLNTAVALTLFEDVIGLKGLDPFQQAVAILHMDWVLGIGVRNLILGDVRIRPKGAKIDEASIQSTLQARQLAREQRNYVQADGLRELLKENGVEVMDGSSDLELGWDWKRD